MNLPTGVKIGDGDLKWIQELMVGESSRAAKFYSFDEKEYQNIIQEGFNFEI